MKPIQNEIVQWNQNFRFEIKIPENSNIDDAKLRISVRREGAKSEVKIGYVDVSENPEPIGGIILDCIIWSLVDTHKSAAPGFGFDHI